MSQNISTNGPIDLKNLSDREQAEKAAFQPTNLRGKRKDRTLALGLKIKPEIRQIMERINAAEGITLTDIVEKGVLLLDRQLKGLK